MHAHAYAFVAHAVEVLGAAPTRVIELGARDVNGSIRPLFTTAEVYVGVDVAPGPAVDLVADAATLTRDQVVPVDGPLFDVAVCCEVFEHAERWPDILARMVDLVRPGGGVIVTCATTGRAPHSAVDGGTLRADEYYANVTPEALAAVMAGLPLVEGHVAAHTDRGDLYVVARVRG